MSLFHNSEYIFEVYDPYGNALADISQFVQTRRFEDTRNHPGTLSVRIALQPMYEYCRKLNVDITDLFQQKRNEIKIKRINPTGDILKSMTYIFGGQIETQKITIDDVDQYMDLNVINYQKLLSDRNMDYVYDTLGQDAGEVAWALIDLIQSDPYGFFGIVKGKIEPTQYLNEQIQVDKNIGDYLIELTERDGGGDIEITPEKVFNVYKQQGKRNGLVKFIYDEGHASNLKRITIDKTGKMGNRIKARGQGYGATQLRSVVNEVGMQDKVFIREMIVDYPGVKNLSALDSHARSDLERYAQFPDLIDITLDQTFKMKYKIDYDLGDRVPITVIGHPIVPNLLAAEYRIDKVAFSLDENDMENSVISLSKP